MRTVSLRTLAVAVRPLTCPLAVAVPLGTLAVAHRTVTRPLAIAASLERTLAIPSRTVSLGALAVTIRAVSCPLTVAASSLALKTLPLPGRTIPLGALAIPDDPLSLRTLTVTNRRTVPLRALRLSSGRLISLRAYLLGRRTRLHGFYGRRLFFLRCRSRDRGLPSGR